MEWSVWVTLALAVITATYFERASCAGNMPRKPHIVFVFADDLGWNDVSFHGSRIQTPTIDRLAENGVILDNYYVQPICSPSRCQFMSGRYQIHNGIQHGSFFYDYPMGLPLDSPTLADKLREAGYSTNMVGKWHLGFFKEEYMPQNRGFDNSFAMLNGRGDHYNHSCDYYDYGYFLDLRRNGAVEYRFDGLHSNYMYTNHAVDLISKHDKNTPLFLFMSFQAPHTPVDPPEIYQIPYNDISDPYRRGYAGLVTMTDEALANLTQALVDAGLWDDTILIFSSDNGADLPTGSSFPLRGGKFSLWEGGVRAVGFVTGGANIDMVRGVVNNELIHVSDWFPTLVDVAGGNLDGTLPLDGVNQWRTISTGASSNRTWLLHNIDPLEPLLGERLFDDTFDTRVMAALRVGDLKILTGDPGNGSWVPPPEYENLTIQYPAEEVASEKNLWLFNITSDPEERRDLSETHPDLVKQMLDFLLQLNSTAVPVYSPDSDPRADPRLHNDIWSPWLT